MKQLFKILFLLFCVNLNAQSPQEELDQFIAKYEYTKLVKLQDEMIVDIKIQKEDLVITKTISETDLILDKKGSLYNEDQIQYSSLTSLNYIEAKTLVPTEKKYKEYKVSDDIFSTKDKLGGSIFFDDTKEVSFFYPKLTQGAKKVLEYQLEVKEPRLMGSFYFQSSMPVENGKLQIITDESVNIGYRMFNTDTFNIKYSKESKKGRTYHTWIAKDIPEYEHESSTLSATHFIPHVVIFIEDYTTKNGNKKILSSLDDLHDWYYTLVKEVNTQDNLSMKPIVDSLINDDQTDLEKVKNIYAWVQSHIKYIAFEDGYGGFIPREAVDICDKRYGDCKDMASIITEMLEIADVKADLTWIGTRDIPYTYEEVFTPNVDNHMIASYTDTDGEIYFLDATSSYLPFGIVSEFIQGKQALINVGEGKYKLADVPVTKTEENFVYDSVSITLENDIIKGNAHFAITGYPKVKFSYFYPSLTEKEKKDYAKDAFEKGNNKFTVSKTSDLNFDNKDKASIINYDFEIASYTNASEDEFYINLHLDKYLKSNDFEDDRVLPYKNPYQYTNKQVVSFQVPDGYEVTYVPENDSYQNDLFNYDIKYEKSGNEVKLTSQVSLTSILIEKENFEDWNKMIKKLNKNYSEVIILKKK